MIRIEIPGWESLDICHIVMDYNGTAAVDGVFLAEAKERILKLKEMAQLYILTADTYGTVKEQCRGLGIEVMTFPREGAAKCKEEIVKGLSGGVVCLGNGLNDIQMFDAADLSIAILEKEGLCGRLLNHADVLVPSFTAGLDLLLKPNRLRATLRT